MKKNIWLLLGILALALVFGFGLAGCVIDTTVGSIPSTATSWTDSDWAAWAASNSSLSTTDRQEAVAAFLAANPNWMASHMDLYNKLVTWAAGGTWPTGGGGGSTDGTGTVGSIPDAATSWDISQWIAWAENNSKLTLAERQAAVAAFVSANPTWVASHMEIYTELLIWATTEDVISVDDGSGPGDDQSGGVASYYLGTYTGTLTGSSATSFTVSADAITGSDITISDVSTGGGQYVPSPTPQASMSVRWDYVYKGGTKIGIAFDVPVLGKGIYLGVDEATKAAEALNGTSASVHASADGVADTYQGAFSIFTILAM